MSTPSSRSPRNDGPAPEDLAGVPACFEDDQPEVRLGGSQPRKGVRTRGAIVESSGSQKKKMTPSADDLAGIPVSAEGDEDLTARRWKPKK